MSTIFQMQLPHSIPHIQRGILPGRQATGQELRAQIRNSRLSQAPIRRDHTVVKAAAVTAASQRDELWKRVLDTAYAAGDLPNSNPGGLGALRVLWPPFSWDTLRYQGDTMPPNHPKLIHAHGAVGKVAFKAASKKYTGIFESGGIGLARLSLARQDPPFRPGLAVKVLIDEGNPSINFVAMNARDGQDDTNFFRMPFSNSLPPPVGLGAKAITGAFQAANATLPVDTPADRPENGSIMPLLEAAQITSAGTQVPNPLVPYTIVFKPDEGTSTLYTEANATHKDMRKALAQLKPGTTLYSMHLMEKDQDVSAGEMIGTLVTESNFVASKFGDEDLFFKHMRSRKL